MSPVHRREGLRVAEAALASETNLPRLRDATSPLMKTEMLSMILECFELGSN